MTFDEIRRINDRRLARPGQKYYYSDRVYIGNADGSLSLFTSVPTQYNPTAGTGIDISGTYPDQTISNTAPDQTVSLTAGTGISTSGTYPSFTVTNTAPDQVVSLTAGTNISISGTYPSFNISSTATTGILHGTASGTDVYTTTITGVTSYNDGDAYLIRFPNGNTTSATLNINSIGTVTLYRNNDGPLIGGDIWPGSEMLCIYNSTTLGFQCIGTSPNSLFAYVTNDDSVTITKGQVVYAFSGTGDRMTVKLANNTSDATSAKTVGVVLSTSIAANQKGIIIMQGLLDGLSILPTTTYTDGDTLYLGATAGSFTNVKPYAPNHLVYVAIVTTANNGSAGRMYVRCQNGYELDEIHDVDLISTPPVNNNVLTYVAGPPNLWKAKSISTILGYTPYDSANPAGYITSAALSPYLTSATAASTYVELAGDTMTGLLQFSGTTHAGIRLNNLTTAQRVALTPSSGMLILDTDLDEFCHYNGAGWEYDLNKSVASNVTTNVTGAANITGLSFAVEANSTFLVDCYYYVSCSGTGGIRFTQTTPAGATMDITYDGIAGTAISSVKIRSAASGSLTATAINSAAIVSAVIVRGFVRTGATAGTLQMQFASNTNGQTSTIFANSWAKITRIV